VSWLSATWSVFCFEWRRTLTLGRMLIWLGLVSFPAAIAALIRVGETVAESQREAVVWDLILFALTGVVCLLALLLWATPIVSEERAGNTWSYLAVRSCGVASVMVGKYLNAVAWAVSTACLAMSAAVLIAQPPGALSLWCVLLALNLLGAPAYAAVFVLLGVTFERIAMGLALVYVLLLEIVVASIPAVINQITIRYRLQTLLARWRDWDIEQYEDMSAIDPGASWQQILILLSAAVVLLGAAIFVTSLRELAKPERG
jgi:hypothetical protein